MQGIPPMPLMLSVYKHDLGKNRDAKEKCKYKTVAEKNLLARYTDKMYNDIIANDKTTNDKMSNGQNA